MLDEFATALAAEIAPDEAPLAPLVARAYAAGGEQRAELFKHGGNVHGAFGIDLLLPYLPGALLTIGKLALEITEFLNNPVVGRVVEVARNSTSIAEISTKLAHLTAGGGAVVAGALPPATADLALFSTLLTRLPAELAASGLPADKVNEVTLKMLRVLVEDPERGKAAVAELGAKS